MADFQNEKKLTKRQKIYCALEKYEINASLTDADIHEIAQKISNELSIDVESVYDFILEEWKQSKINHQKEINKELNLIVREVHNEFGRFGKHREVSEICERANIDKKTAKRLLDNFGMQRGQWEEMGLWKKTGEEKKQEEQQRLAEQQQRLVKQQESIYKKMAKCPRCGSTSLSYDTKKLSIGRALVGDAIAGAPGAILGGLSSKKGYAVCLNCGKRWKI